MVHPYRDSQAEETPKQIGGEKVIIDKFEFDVVEATVTWEDPRGGAQSARKTYSGSDEPNPDYPGGICLQMFRNTPNILTGDEELQTDLIEAARRGVFIIDKDTYIPWHRVINVTVTKRTLRSFTVKWVRYQYGK